MTSDEEESKDGMRPVNQKKEEILQEKPKDDIIQPAEEQTEEEMPQKISIADGFRNKSTKKDVEPDEKENQNQNIELPASEEPEKKSDI